MIARPDVRRARLSVADLDDVALGLRLRSIRGDLVAGAVAEALESVIVRRQAAQLAHDRRAAAKFVSSTWQRVTAWATTR